MVRHNGELHQIEVPQLVEMDSLFHLGYEANNHDKMEQLPTIPSSEAIAQSNQTNEFFWIDNYKCSLCGTELPPSFINERQEHFDFHLAQRLQKEESNFNSRSHLPVQRYLSFCSLCNTSP